MKKVIGLLIFLSISVLFVGCLFYRMPTAEKLLSQQYFKDAESSYIDANLKMDVETHIDMGDFIDEDASAEELLAATISVNTNLNIKGDNQIQYLDGIIDANFYGYELSIPATSYTIINSENVTVYDYDYEFENWTSKETIISESPYIDLISFLNQFNTETIQDYQLSETTKNDATYLVTGTMNTKYLMNILDATDMFEDTFSITELNVNDDSVSNIIILYDKETLIPVSYNIDTTNTSNPTNLTICLSVNSIGPENKVAVPQEIIDKSFCINY